MRIEEFPNLWASLGKARGDRVRNHTTNKQDIGTSRTRWVPNPHQLYLSGLYRFSDQHKLDDILTGCARAEQDGSKVSLSTTRLFVLLQCNKRISTDLVKVTMDLEDRQARRYMAAARLAIYFISRDGFANDFIEEGLIDNPWTIEITK